MNHFLPVGLLENFNIVRITELCNVSEKSHYLEINLEENNKILQDLDCSLYESKGFTEITLHDFPLRGKAVFLILKRRRWRLKSDKQVVVRNEFPYVAEGSGFTKDLSEFLKVEIDRRIDTITNIGSYYGVNSEKLNRHYKKKTSGFNDWAQKEHAEKYLLFEENIGSNLSIDEVNLSKGELYTFLTNKSGKGRNGTLVACIRGTLSKDIIEVLEKISIEKRLKVTEVTLDMAKNMESAMKKVFPNAKLVTDRFHVVRLPMEALQHIRVNIKWKEMDKENAAVKLAKQRNEKYKPEELANGDTHKQLLARSRYALAKNESEWTENQKERTAILFTQYPELKTAYHQTMAFRNIYEDRTISSARIRFTDWCNNILEKQIKEFYTVANTVKNNLDNILNFFINRSTNANAESFNSKLKLFRANLRGVTDTKFFLFRLTKLFA